MKILFVTMQLGQGYGQGTERYVTTLGHCLQRRGHEVGCLAGDPLHLRAASKLGRPLDPASAGQVHFPIYHCPTSGWMAVDGNPTGLQAWIEAWQPDLIHVANPAHIGTAAIAIARSLGIPVVVTAMDFWWICPKATLLRDDGRVCDGTPGWRECLACITRSHSRPTAKLLGGIPTALMPVVLPLYQARALLRGMPLADLNRWPGRREFLAARLASADHLIFPSAAMSDALQPFLAPERCTRIPYGLPAEWFIEPRPARERVVEAAELTVGFAGALLPHKGVHVLLDAIARLRWTRTRVCLAGPASDNRYLDQLRARAGDLRVEFAGAIPAAEMPRFLRSLDVLVLPSLWPENLPFIMLEAHAAGVPVIASRLSGVRDQIGQDHLLFEPGSAQGLAHSLDWLRLHPQSARPGSVLTDEEMTTHTLNAYRSIGAI